MLMTVPAKTMELLLVSAAGGEEVLAPVVRAGRVAFGETVVREGGSLQMMLAEPRVEHPQMVVLVKADAGTVRAAQEALDACLLPRWAVLLIEDETLLESKFALSRAMSDAWKLHLLERDNARLKGDMKAVARRVNHDLRSPLGGITTTAELIKELMGESSPELASLTDPLFDSAQSMIRLMDRISFMARAVTERPVKDPVVMAEVVWAAEQRLQRPLMKKKITVRHPAGWPEVAGVAGWLEVVWLNLLANAVEHAPAESAVELFWEPAAELGIRLGVRDEGKGVPPAKRGQLFHPFNLLHQANSPHGLGLPIVQRLVEMQGGVCGCDFLEPRGSVFYFTLPA